jgi:hypothetical protein
MSEAGPVNAAAPQVAEFHDEAAIQVEPGRREKRFPVIGSVEVIVDGGKSLFRGRIVNISKSGCYVHTPASVCLSPGMPVEIVTTVRGTVLRLSAKARFSKPKGGIGFLFTVMSGVTRGRLSDLIASLQAAPEAQEQAPPRVWQDAF